MKTDKIFIADIIHNQDKIGTDVFYKLDDKFILLNDIDNIIDLIKFKSNLFNIRTFDTDSSNEYYIDSNSILPYYSDDTNKSFKKIKNDYLYDSRNPIGINH